MAKTLEKTRKHISKKKNGNISSLHVNSRDSKRLHGAQVRDERLEKIARTRKMQMQPLLSRVKFFRGCVRENGGVALDLDSVQVKINEFVHQHDEEYDSLKSARRAGRPASSREDLVKLEVVALLKEQQNGFYMPDLTDERNIQALERWEGSWSYLNNLAWVKILGSGEVKPSSFPPNSH